STFRCSPRSPTKVIPSGSSGESIEGPVCAEVSINALRYGAELGRTFTYSSGPTLTTIFPSTFSPGGTPPPPPPPPVPPGGPPPPPPPPPSLEQEFRRYEVRLGELTLQLIGLQADNRTAAAALDRALRVLKDLVLQSDDAFINQGP